MNDSDRRLAASANVGDREGGRSDGEANSRERGGRNCAGASRTPASAGSGDGGRNNEDEEQNIEGTGQPRNERDARRSPRRQSSAGSLPAASATTQGGEGNDCRDGTLDVELKEMNKSGKNHYSGGRRSIDCGEQGAMECLTPQERRKRKGKTSRRGKGGA